MQEIDPTKKKEDLLNSVTSAVDDLCQCGFSGKTFHDTTATFQCFDNSPTAVTFRGEIGSTMGANNSQVISYMEKWVATNPTIVIQSSRLSVDGNCNVKIDSFNDPECGSMILTVNDDSDDININIGDDDSDDINIGAIIGLTGGVLTTLIIAVSLVVVIVILLVRTRKKKASREVNNRDGANIYEYVHHVYGNIP